MKSQAGWPSNDAAEFRSLLHAPRAYGKSAAGAGHEVSPARRETGCWFGDLAFSTTATRGAMMTIMDKDVGVVVIGRNEGDRLRRCLLSLADVPWRVYVDSGSTDGSCEVARELGFDVVALASPPPFSAARARNRGIDRLRELNPSLAFAQTVDGDCEMQAAWICSGLEDMAARPDVAIVSGQVRERNPHVNAYHRACEREWTVREGYAGYVKSVGGIALLRLSAFYDVGGFNPALMGGEEPDLCLRLRQRGWAIWSNDQEMALHDAAIGRFSQWWQRARRGGYAAAQLVALHGRNSETAWVRSLFSAAFWSFLALMGALLGVAGGVTGNKLLLVGCAGLVLLLLMQTYRLARVRIGSSDWKGACDAGLMLISRIAALQGIVQLLYDRVTGVRSSPIEYKGFSPESGP